jgi:hypothetical protein
MKTGSRASPLFRVAVLWTCALASPAAARGGGGHVTYVPIVIPGQPAGPPAEQKGPGSVFVRCDGYPAHQTPADLAVRLVAIMATAGLAGPGELADARKRAHGDDGVAACAAALGQETEPLRRAQLTLGRAAHQIEAGHFEDALADARSVDTVAGPRAAEAAYRRGPMLTGLELRAAALLRLDKPDEATDTAVRMADLDPWDEILQLRAARFVTPRESLDPATLTFLDRLARINPQALLTRAHALEWAGDWRGAADSMATLIEVYAGFAKDSPAPQPALRARVALDLAMAGETARSDALATVARGEIDSSMASGGGVNGTSVLAEAGDTLDLREIVLDLAAGRAEAARTRFAARSNWLSAGPALVAALTDRLRAGAPAGQLTGPLARTGAAQRADARRQTIAALLTGAQAETALWSAFRPPLADNLYSVWDRPVWRTDRSPFIAVKTGKETTRGDCLILNPANGVPTGEALLMHAAMLARSHGAPGFVIHPYRPKLNIAWVMYGAVGDPGMPASAYMDAGQVIAGLSGRFPDPHAGR